MNKEKINEYINEKPVDKDSPSKITVKKIGNKITEMTFYNKLGDIEYFIDTEKIDQIKERIKKIQEESKSKDTGIEKGLDSCFEKDIPANIRDRILELVKAQGFMESKANMKNLKLEKVKQEYEKIKNSWTLLGVNYIPLGNNLNYEEEIWTDKGGADSDNYKRFLKYDDDTLAGITEIFKGNDNKIYRKYELLNVYNEEKNRYENLEVTILIRKPDDPKIISVAKINPTNNDYIEYIDEEKLNKAEESYMWGAHTVKAEEIFEIMKDLSLKKVEAKMKKK